MKTTPSSRRYPLIPVLLFALGLAAGGCTRSKENKPLALGQVVAEGPANNLQVTSDGATLAFLLDVKPSPEKNAPEGVLQGVLTTVATADGKPRPLGGGVTSLEDGYRLSFDGRHIAYLQGFQFRTQSGSLNLAPMPEGEPRLLAHEVKYYRFSGDSKHLGYVAQGEMHLVDLASGADRVLAREVATFEFSRDGQAVLIRRSFSAGGGLLLARLDAPGEPRQLGERVGDYGFAPDGSAVAFTARVGGPSEPYSLFVGPVDGRPRRVAEGVSVFTFSPDSKWVTSLTSIAINQDYGSLQLVAVADGTADKIGDNVVEHRWSPDSKAIALRESHEDKSGKAWMTFRVMTIPERKVRWKADGIPNGFINFVWSSDGRHLAYLQRDSGALLRLQLLALAGEAEPRTVDEWVFGYQFSPGDRALWYRSNCVRNGRECELLEASVEDPTAKPKRLSAGIQSFRLSSNGDRLLLMYPRIDTEHAVDLGWTGLQPGDIPHGVDQYVLPNPVFLDKEGTRVAYIVSQRKREGVHVAELKQAPTR